MFKKKIKTVVTIEGMHCAHCAGAVTDALKKLDNIGKVRVSLGKMQALITSDVKLDHKKIKKAIEELDFKVIEIIEK